MILALIGALSIGVSLGLLGSGGSILTLPVLVYLLGQNERVAIAGSLAIVGAIALAGAIPSIIKKQVDWRTVLWFGLPGMLGTYLGALLASFIPALAQLALFAVIMLIAAYKMLSHQVVATASQTPRGHFKIIADGLGVGIITGLVGVGGGFLIVPALALLGGLSMHRAIATSLVIITLKSASGFIKYLDVIEQESLALDWSQLFLVAGIGIIGSFLGHSIKDRLNQEKLKRFFGVFLVLMAIYILFNTLPQLI